MAALVNILLPAELREANECIVERWLRKAGEPVRAHEPLLEVNTDKAVVEVPSPADGVLQDVLKKENDTVSAGDVLGRINPASWTSAATAEAGRPTAGPSSTGVSPPSEAGESQLSPA